MKPRTEELLNILLWSAGVALNPTLRNQIESFEGSSYRNGLLTPLGRLEKRKWIERKSKSRDDRVYRLCDCARVAVLGGRDPEAKWQRAWDGRWRLVLFDLPVERNAQRARLRRYLQKQGFGNLQKSVWISPDPLVIKRRVLAKAPVNVRSLIFLEATPCAGESTEEIVAAAWDFEEINARYSQFLKVLRKRPTGRPKNETALRNLLRWMSEERKAWREAITNDPLLPAKALPANYLGRKRGMRGEESCPRQGSNCIVKREAAPQADQSHSNEFSSNLFCHIGVSHMRHPNVTRLFLAKRGVE